MRHTIFKEIFNAAKLIPVIVGFERKWIDDSSKIPMHACVTTECDSEVLRVAA